MPVLQQQSNMDSSVDVSSADSTVSSPFAYCDNTSGNSLRSISELLGLNMPRGPTIGQTSQNLSTNMWSPPTAASTPLPSLKHHGMRPPCFSPFTNFENGIHPLDTSQHRSMPQANKIGFDLTQPFSPISPLCAIRGSPPYSDCSSPMMEQALIQGWTSRSNTPSDSDASNVSSTDISEMVNSLSLTQSRGICSPPTEQELANLHALHTLTSNLPVGENTQLRSVQHPQPVALLYTHLNAQLNAQLESRHWPHNDNVDLLDKVARFHRNQAASFFEAACTWSGVLPPRYMDNPTFSCKVFLGGVPWDVTEETLVCVFNQFGKVRVEWPGKDQAASQPKGYAYIIFESEKQVKALLNNCTRNYSSGNCENWYFRISSRKMKSKEVQIIPWCQADSNFVQTPSQKLDPHTTVFVGALHGMLNAEGLFKIMSDLFGGVIYSGIDTDKFKYPIGSARVTFNNRHSYMKAVVAAFIEIKTTKFTKKVQVDPYLEDSPCSNCVVQQGPYFCRELTCFRYFCRSCWTLQHQYDLHSSHKPLMRSSKNNNGSPPQMRFMQQ